MAGPVIGLNYKECTDWRKYTKRELGKYKIIGISPMRFKEQLNEREIILDSDNTLLECDKGIAIRARFDIEHCSLMLANLLGAKEVSKGTMIEYGWADAFRKSIIIVIERERNVHEHPILRDLTGFRVETLEEGIYIARSILNY